MKETRKFADETLSSFLENHAFKKKGSVWELTKEEFQLLIELQKSQWSDAYYINVGIKLLNLNEKIPKAYKSEVQYRITKTENGKVQDTFILDTEISIIQNLINEQIISRFTKLNTKKELKEFIERDQEKYLITLAGREILGI